MTTNHVLCFSWHRPINGRESQAFETFNAMKAYWTKQKTAGNVVTCETMMLAATGNEHLPVGMMIVTGERTKLQALRWDDQDFLNMHAMALTSLHGYACVDGYTGEAMDRQMQRFATLLKK